MKKKGDLVLGGAFGVLAAYFLLRAVVTISLFAIPKLCFSIIFFVVAVRFLRKYLG